LVKKILSKVSEIVILPLIGEVTSGETGSSIQSGTVEIGLIELASMGGNP